MNADDGMILRTHSPEETEQLGYRLAQCLPPGSVVALYGDLASGKTCLVRGMAMWFAKDDPVHSPTFTLVNEYSGTGTLYHLDCYRLSGPEEMADLGYEELFDSAGVCAVEWAERAAPLLPTARVEIRMEHGGEDAREIRIINSGVLPEGWQVALASA